MKLHHFRMPALMNVTSRRMVCELSIHIGVKSISPIWKHQTYPNRSKVEAPKWSPSQPDVLAFLKPESSGVWIRYIDGTERQFGKNTQDVNFVQWSFDGQFIALIINRDLEVQDEDNDADIVIVSPPPLTTVSEIVILHVDSGEASYVAESNVGEFYEGLVWHPDGNWLTVHSAIESQDQRDTNWCLFDIDRRSGVRKNRIGPSKNEMTLPSWSPCGTFLALGYSPL